MSDRYLILGAGQLGSVLKADLKLRFPDSEVLLTSRKTGEDLIFDQMNKSTWSNLPAAKVIFWTFPPSSKSLEFFKEKKSLSLQWVVVGTTGSFKHDKESELINETSPFDLSKERAKVEWGLNKNGASLVMSVGIYSELSNPIHWISKGLVGRSRKYINLIHLEDLSQFVVSAGLSGQKGKIFIASDNNPTTWNEAIDVWEQKGLVKDTHSFERETLSKKIDSSWSIKNLQVDLKFQNFVETVSSMHQSS